MGKKLKNKKVVFGFLLVIIIAVAGISYATINKSFLENKNSDLPLYEVKEGPLRISIPVAGTIRAKEKEVIKSELEGNSTILYIVPEGTHVKKGDILVQLDASSQQDLLIDQEIKVQNAESAFINARENMAITENQAKSDIAEARLLYEFAKQDLEKYKEGEFPKLLKETENNIMIKEEELTQAKEDLRWSQILYEEKYLPQSDLQRDEIAAKKAEVALEIAKSDLDLLLNFEYKRQIAQLESDVEQAKMALERTLRQANANIVQASAELQAKESEYERQLSKLKKLEEQIAKATILAPRDGLAIHASSVRQSWRGNNEPLQEGQQVHEREELIHLPTTSSYLAEVSIHESYLEKLHVGLPVIITIDALPGKTYLGKIDKIAPLPDAQSVFMNPDLKVYNTEISIEGDTKELRSGMSCQAEVIIDQFDNTTYIPVQCVLKVNNIPTVYIYEKGEIKAREIEIGPDNNRLVQVKSGLQKGELVLLKPPLSSAEISEQEKSRGDIVIPEVQDQLDVVSQNQTAPAMGAQGIPQGGAPQGQGGERRGRGGMGGGREGRGGAGAPGAVLPPAGEGRGAGRFSEMTDEQREEMRKRFENMSPEEREAMRQRFQNRENQQNSENGGQE